MLDLREKVPVGSTTIHALMKLLIAYFTISQGPCSLLFNLQLNAIADVALESTDE
jgi:hypothetical protein